jgi:serine-type D-Ala-D-Ala carboxypeptidase/endopeptidase (penicillin-binding protein 4)
MFNFQRHTTYIILLTSYLILASCSIQKQIAKSANEDVLSTKALQTAHVGISIYEPAANKYLYNYQGDKYFVPASNTKLPTCYAAMKYLGDSLVGLRCQIINDSLIKIKSTGDPTFLNSDFEVQPIYIFLKKYKYISFSGDLFSETFLGPGWTWNDYKEYYSAQRSDFPIYGNIVKFKWEDENKITVSPLVFTKSIGILERLKTGFEIIKPWDENNFIFLNGNVKYKEVPFRPDAVTVQSLLQDTLGNFVNSNFDKEGYAQSTELTFSREKNLIRVPNGSFNYKFTAIHSQPTDSLLKPMMHRSDNFFAEQTLLMVSNERLHYMSDEKIIDTLLKTDFKDLPQKPRWVDGSGLSRYNLFTPQDFVAILNKMKNEFGMERIKVILPTGGEGTISSYYKADSGYIYGKTGTLSGVVAFSGFLYTKKGKLLIFSTLVNNHQASATEVRRAMEKFIQGIRNKY